MKNRGQGTMEYLIFSGALIAVLFFFFIKGLPWSGPSCGCKTYNSFGQCIKWRTCFSAPPLGRAIMSTLRQPSQLVADQVLDTTRLDIYTITRVNMWPPDTWMTGTDIFPSRNCPPAVWVGWDTCSTTETARPAVGDVTACEPGRTYTCNELYCATIPSSVCDASGLPSPPDECYRMVTFPKSCNAAGSSPDTCDGDYAHLYACPPTAESTCTDYYYYYTEATQNFRQATRDVVCTPICCPS